jgi:hypothetical protein
VKGTNVRYIGTETTGKVVDLSIQNNVGWAKIDKTGLYYRTDYLEVIKPKIKIKKLCVSKKEKYEQRLPKLNDLKKATATEISEHSDSAGYGGG